MESMVSRNDVRKAFEQLLETPEMLELIRTRLEVLYPGKKFVIAE